MKITKVQLAKIIKEEFDQVQKERAAEVGEELDEGKIADAFMKMLSKISEKYFGALERILEKWHDKVGDKNINKIENFVLDLQDKLTNLSNRFQGTTKFDYEKEGMRPPHVPAAEWKSMDPEQKKAAYAEGGDK